MLCPDPFLLFYVLGLFRLRGNIGIFRRRKGMGSGNDHDRRLKLRSPEAL